MGGLGSGGHNRKHGLIAETPAIDVSDLHRAGVLAPGWSGMLTLSLESQQVATIGAGRSGRLAITYSGSAAGGAQTQLGVNWSPCRFGGCRAFLCCPHCGRPVNRLYFEGRLLCRICHGLTYRSQRERSVGRALRKATKAAETRIELGVHPGLAHPFPRPKGMHRRTHAELLAADAEAMRLVAVATVITVFKRLYGMSERNAKIAAGRGFATPFATPEEI